MHQDTALGFELAVPLKSCIYQVVLVMEKSIDHTHNAKHLWVVLYFGLCTNTLYNNAKHLWVGIHWQ